LGIRGQKLVLDDHAQHLSFLVRVDAVDQRTGTNVVPIDRAAEGIAVVTPVMLQPYCSSSIATSHIWVGVPDAA
jgi:hypothetical protein